MANFIEILKVIFLGIVEGITEWLPISSTGHMLLVDEFIKLGAADDFKEMFFYVIQLGAILAVVLLFWDRMFPFNLTDKSKPVIKKDIFSMWFKVVVACIPGAVVTILFDDFIEAHLHTPFVIAAALIFYGIAFIVVENLNKNRTVKVALPLGYHLQNSLYHRTFSGAVDNPRHLEKRLDHNRRTHNRRVESCGG